MGSGRRGRRRTEVELVKRTTWHEIQDAVDDHRDEKQEDGVLQQAPEQEGAHDRSRLPSGGDGWAPTPSTVATGQGWGLGPV
ncbi:MAG TPA: hypothetical protein DCP73_08670 [Chloroflexi bacterium]|nr:hypothetical protein [Chloroflexota bacterium]